MPYGFTPWTNGEKLKNGHGGIGHGEMTNLMLGWQDFIETGQGILNGDFEVWQDGTSFAAIADGTYTADNFVYLKSGAVVHTASRDSSSVPTPDQWTPAFNYTHKLQVTTADASIAAGDYCALEHRMEGTLARPFMRKEFTVSFWVRTHSTGNYCLYVKNSGKDRTYVIEFAVTVADTWEFKTLTIPASPSAGAWNTTTGTGFRIGFTQYVGATYQIASGAWQTGDFYGSGSQTNNCATTNENMYIAGLRLSLGPNAGAFRQVPEPLTRLLSSRYFYKTPTAGSGDVYCFGQVYQTSSAILIYQLPITPRAIPSLAVSAASDFNLTDVDFLNRACTGATTFAVYRQNDRSVAIQIAGITAAGLVKGNATMLTAANTSAYLKFNGMRLT